MNPVLNNPYRVLGLLVGSSATKQKEQTNRLKRFLEGNQLIKEDFSFPVLGILSRTPETVNEAISKLNSNNDKITAALFWYYIGIANTDKLAFEAIKDGHINKGLNIWSNLISNGEVTRLNSSAYHNLSTFYLSGIAEDTNSNLAFLEKGVALKLKFLESEFSKDFYKLAMDEALVMTKKNLQLLFLDQMQSELEYSELITSGKLLNIIMVQEFLAKEEFLKEYSQKLVKKIENKIQEAKNNSKENKILAGEFGNELYDSTKNQLKQLSSVLGLTDINFILISDKLANGILQCSIYLFNHFHNTDTEVGKIALDLNRKAQAIVLGSLTKARIKESTKIVENYNKDWPTRVKLSKAKSDLKYINDHLEKFQLKEHTISNAVNFANECKPLLKNLKLKVGTDNKIYSTLSTIVACNAQNMVVSIVNKAVERRNNYVKYYNCLNDPFYKLTVFLNLDNGSSSDVHYLPENSLEMLRSEISEAWHATVSFGSFDMARKERNNYNKNNALLLELHKQLNPVFLYFKNSPVDKWVMRLIGIVI